MSSLTGSCICGSVVVEILDADKVMRKMACHCTHCQKGAGGPYQTNALFRREYVRVEDVGGKLVKYVFPGWDVASGFPKEKWFCSECGCTLFTKPLKHNGEVFAIKTGILTGLEGEDLAPTQEFFIRDRMSFVVPIVDAAQFQTMPSAKNERQGQASVDTVSGT